MVKLSYELTDADISTRRPSTYWKQCSTCREYLKQRGKICMDCNKPVDIYLNISFDDKDKYKKYGTKWNPNVKKWYWSGCKDKLPPELIPLKRV